MKINKYHIFICIVIFQYLCDRLTNNCERMEGEVLLFIHHIISIYGFLGGILFNPFYHLLAIISVGIYRYFNEWNCPITILTHNLCKFKKTDLFRDFLYFINDKGNFIYMFIIILYDIYRIYTEKIFI